MPYLAIGEENSERTLALFAVNNAGQLYNPASVEYVIYNKSTGTRVQVYPSSGREDVEGLNTDDGIFVARDVSMDIGLTPGTSWDAEEGLHSIKWWYADYDDPTVIIEWELDFYVEAEGLEAGYWTYISPTQLREEGLSEDTVSDAWMVELIKRAQEYIEAACKQPFRPVISQFKMSGSNGAKLFMNLPIIGIQWLKANYSTVALDVASYHAYANPTTRRDPGWRQEDHRRNPIIEMVQSPDLYSGRVSMLGGVFVDNPANQEIRGVFGFLEADGRTPKLIEEAAKRLVFGTAERLSVGSSSSSSTIVGPVKRLTVDRHTQEWDTASSSVSLSSSLAVSTQVEEILRMYRAPIMMA